MTLSPTSRRAVATAVACLLALTPAPATAAPEGAPAKTAPAKTAPGGVSGAASVGNAVIRTASELLVDIPPLATCVSGESTGAETSGATGGKLVAFGQGSTTCETEPSGAVTATATGKAFRFNHPDTGLPLLKVGSYTISCRATPDGTVESAFTLRGVVGTSLPDTVPVDYETTLTNGVRAVFNTRTWAEDGDGSLTVHAVRLWLGPDMGPATRAGERGAVTVGSVTCTPPA